MAAVPAFHACKQEGDGSDECAHHDHGMKADETTAEEFACREGFAPAVVVGVADDKPREHEEEVYG